MRTQDPSRITAASINSMYLAASTSHTEGYFTPFSQSCPHHFQINKCMTRKTQAFKSLGNSSSKTGAFSSLGSSCSRTTERLHSSARSAGAEGSPLGRNAVGCRASAKAPQVLDGDALPRHGARPDRLDPLHDHPFGLLSAGGGTSVCRIAQGNIKTSCTVEIIAGAPGTHITFPT